jgi:hypothetical protein
VPVVYKRTYFSVLFGNNNDVVLTYPWLENTQYQRAQVRGCACCEEWQREILRDTRHGSVSTRTIHTRHEYGYVSSTSMLAARTP